MQRSKIRSSVFENLMPPQRLVKRPAPSLCRLLATRARAFTGVAVIHVMLSVGSRQHPWEW